MLSLFTRRFFSKTSKRTMKLAQTARKLRKVHGYNQKQDLIQTVLPTEQQKTAFDSRPLPKAYRQFISDVFHLANEEVKCAYSIENGTHNEIQLARKIELAKRFGKNEKDFGHPAVKVATLTENVMSLANHVRKNNTDTLAYLNLRKALDKRRKAMQYLARNNYHEYEELCNYYGINKLNYPHHKEVKNIKIIKS